MKAFKTFNLGGVEVLKDTELMCQFPHSNPNEWKNPLEFHPERFDPSSEYYQRADGKSRHRLAFTPFSSGPRACPGMFLAMLEIKIALIMYLKFDIFAVDESAIVPTDDETSFTFFTKQ